MYVGTSFISREPFISIYFPLGRLVVEDVQWQSCCKLDIKYRINNSKLNSKFTLAAGNTHVTTQVFSP